MVQANIRIPSVGRAYSRKKITKALKAIPGTRPLAPSAILKALIKPTQNNVVKNQATSGTCSRLSNPIIPSCLGTSSGQSQNRPPHTANLAISRKKGVRKSVLISSAKPNNTHRAIADHKYISRSNRTTPGV